MAASKNPKKGIEPHPLVAALQPDPKKPPARTVKLLGFVGEAPESGTARLWLDTELVNYVDVPTTAILHSTELPNEAGTLLWVAADSQLTYGSTADAATIGAFLSGAIASRHLPTAATGFMGGGSDSPVPAMGSLPLLCNTHEGCTPSKGCQTQFGSPCGSLPGACPSSVGAGCSGASRSCPSATCPSVTPCASAVCAPTTGACFTHTNQCPTSPARCHQTINPVCIDPGTFNVCHTIPVYGCG
jgi:hypothetical protein